MEARVFPYPKLCWDPVHYFLACLCVCSSSSARVTWWIPNVIEALLSLPTEA